jgi:cytochrome c551/c552
VTSRLLWCAAIVFAVATVPALTQGQLPAARTSIASPPDAAFLKQYCVSCHNARVKSGGLALDVLDPLMLEGHADVWEKVVRKLRTGMMPPDGAPRPAPAARETFTASLESALDRLAARQLDRARRRCTA